MTEHDKKAEQLRRTLSEKERGELKKAYAGKREELNKALARAMQGEAEAAQELRKAILSTPQGRELLHRLQEETAKKNQPHNK